MLAEVEALRTRGALIRIPGGQDVPITPRVRRLIDTAAFRRLASISQLGMVSLVYPGATHSRFEHSLGVYHNALRLLARFDADPAFRTQVDPAAAEAFVLAALLHDIAHWPFCHPIEDMRLDRMRGHESRVADWLATDEVSECLHRDWAVTADSVNAVLRPPRTDLAATDPPPTASRENAPSIPVQVPGTTGPGTTGPGTIAPKTVALLHSCMSGPIDVDKLDYLQRDSLHAGVPYGCNFDAARLISSMCVHPVSPRLAVGEKGRTAAEMMVFARYVMFSEVYWHHTVRAATAMLQRAVFLLRDEFDLEGSLRMDDATWVKRLRHVASGTDSLPLVDGLFGPRRLLYKRAAEYSVTEGAEVHRRLARRPYWWLLTCAERLAERLAPRCPDGLLGTDVLIDAPPVKLEVDINVDVVGRDGNVRPLGDVSPVASALAREQFDDQVKRVRVFVRADRRDAMIAATGGQHGLADMLTKVTDELEQELV